MKPITIFTLVFLITASLSIDTFNLDSEGDFTESYFLDNAPVAFRLSADDSSQFWMISRKSHNLIKIQETKNILSLFSNEVVYEYIFKQDLNASTPEPLEFQLVDRESGLTLKSVNLKLYFSKN